MREFVESYWRSRELAAVAMAASALCKMTQFVMNAIVMTIEVVKHNMTIVEVMTDTIAQATLLNNSKHMDINTTTGNAGNIHC